MEVPLTGVFAFILLIPAILIGHKVFLHYAIFFMPFSAVSVFNFTASENTISYSLFFSLTYLISFLIFRLGVFNLLKVKFGVVGFVFIFYLFIIHFFLENNLSNDQFINEFSYFQLLYLIIGVLLTLSIAIDIYKHGYYVRVLNTIVFSMFIAGLVGLYQVLSFNYGLYYPVEYFNNSISPYAQGYSAVLGDGLKRISSVSTEPSIFAQWLVVCSSIFIFMKLLGTKLGVFTGIVLINNFFILVLSTSATAYIGIFILFGLILFTKLTLKKNLEFLVLIIAFTLLVFIFSAPYIAELILLKLSSYSFMERFSSIIFGWLAFLESPLVGSGWGVITVHSLIVGLLANTGLIGLIIFCYWMCREISMSIKFSVEKKALFNGQSVLFSVFILIILQVVTGFVYTYSFYWIIFGILVGQNLLAYSYRKQTRL
uniref:Wzy n=1 Tax=Hydrogenovibrio crunogenus (strain DSM 25203 / XCL-2) TaxID=317025 RepID=Q31EZ8_HYDCU